MYLKWNARAFQPDWIALVSWNGSLGVASSHLAPRPPALCSLTSPFPPLDWNQETWASSGGASQLLTPVASSCAHPIGLWVACEGLGLLCKTLSSSGFYGIVLTFHHCLSIFTCSSSSCQTSMISKVARSTLCSSYSIFSTWKICCFQFPPISSRPLNLYWNFNLSHVQISSFQLPTGSF